jgi:regulator of replication initiation timing
MAPTTHAQNLEELDTKVNNMSENMNSLNQNLNSLSQNLNSLTQQVHKLVLHIKGKHKEYHSEATHSSHYENTHLSHSPWGSPNS